MLTYVVEYKNGEQEYEKADDDKCLLRKLGNKLWRIKDIYEKRYLDYDILYYADSEDDDK